MLKKFLNGMVFGAGFAISFIVINIIYFQFFFIDSINSRASHKDSPVIAEEVTSAPKPVLDFLGSSAVFSGGFPSDRNKTLAKGKGKIVGSINTENKPVKGVKIRLGLNKEVMSQWAVTDANGNYEISVPLGEYQINGYELDFQSANKKLPGLIDSPRNIHASGIFTVNESQNGLGLNLSFVKPVTKLYPQRELNINQDVIIDWGAYPGAAHYMIQVYRKKGATDYITNDTLFDWSDRAQASGTSLKLNGLSKKLAPGFYYVFEVHAINASGKHISSSERQHNSYDFYISEQGG